MYYVIRKKCNLDLFEKKIQWSGPEGACGVQKYFQKPLNLCTAHICYWTIFPFGNNFNFIKLFSIYFFREITNTIILLRSVLSTEYRQSIIKYIILEYFTRERFKNLVTENLAGCLFYSTTWSPFDNIT